MSSPYDQMLVANEFFLLAREEREGSPYLGQSIEAAAVAAAVLGELLMDHMAVIHQGLVYDQSYVLDRFPEPHRVRILRDPALQIAIGIIAGQRQPPPVAALIEFLGDKVHRPVVDRLVAASDIEIRRGLRGVRYVPRDQFVWARPRSLLWGAATNDGHYRKIVQPTGHMMLLAGLTLATGLVNRVTTLATNDEVHNRLLLLAQGLPEPLQVVVASVEQVVRRLATRR